jgi:hypothetical protein
MTGKTYKKQAGPTSLHPLTPDQALGAALRVNPADVKRLEKQEKAKKRRAGKKK